jgi:hypothetical protein
MQQSDQPTTIEVLHEQACREGRSTYTDPVTGYAVFTAAYLRDRGTCCDSGCRHCPYRGDAENARAAAE